MLKIEKYATNGQGIRVINAQHVDRDSPDLRPADQRRAVPLEVIRPTILAWMVQSNDLVPICDPPCHVWALVRVAVEATPSQIRFNRRTTVFLRDDVIDLKRVERMFVRELTVFTDAPRSIANELPQNVIHATVTLTAAPCGP